MIKKKIKNFDIQTLSESGQIFRLNKISDNLFSLIIDGIYLEIKKIDDSNFLFSCSNDYFNTKLVHFFDLDTDYSFYKKLANKNDIFLQKCIKYGENIKILNQDPFEMLISFIISQRKSIKAIRTSIERLCKMCSKKHEIISEFTNKKIIYYPFPTENEILKCKNELLNTCGLGYRKEYILNACRLIKEKRIILNDLFSLQSNELIENLMKFKGVGIKVASCIALFAYHRFDICPIDVWIKRVIEQKYNGKIPTKYLPYIGIIQQYWFNYARLEKLK